MSLTTIAVFFVLLINSKTGDTYFNCVFSTRIWNYLMIPWIPGSASEALLSARKSFVGPLFCEVLILACWCIWKQRNWFVFKNIGPTFRGRKKSFFHEVTLLRYRVKQSVYISVSAWLDSLH